MSAQILSGKDIAAKLLSGLKADVKKLDPKLVIVQVGDDPASASYIKQKFKACAEVGMRREHLHLPENCTEKELMDTVQKLNSDRDVTGFIVQLPLPKHLQHLVETITERIDPKKDVDGFGAAKIGRAH